MRSLLILPFGLLLAVTSAAGQDVPLELPKGAKPIPATRQEMKEALNALKDSKPRLPLPPDDGGGKGVNNGRMRSYYVPAELRVGGVGSFGGGFGGFGGKKGTPPAASDPDKKKDGNFNTKLFWIVCRINNCQYCLGHQEGKLASSGVPEDMIAALDGDWSEFSDKEKLAFGLTRKLTFQPHLVDRADIEPLKKHWSDAEIFNMICSIAGFNAMNRWTDGLAIPQEKQRDFTKAETSPKYKDRRSQVALLPDAKGVLPSSMRRPPVPTREQIDQALSECRTRSSWLELAPVDEARKLLPEELASGAVPNWVRAYAISRSGTGRVKGQYVLYSKGNLDPKLRAQIDWIAALHDRAWYALGHAEQRLRAAGETEKNIMALAGTWDNFTDKEKAAFRLVRISTVAPMAVADDDFVELRKLYSETQVGELVHRICEAAYFNRVTEATKLPLEK